MEHRDLWVNLSSYTRPFKLCSRLSVSWDEGDKTRREKRELLSEGLFVKWSTMIGWNSAENIYIKTSLLAFTLIGNKKKFSHLLWRARDKRRGEYRGLLSEVSFVNWTKMIGWKSAENPYISSFIGNNGSIKAMLGAPARSYGNYIHHLGLEIQLHSYTEKLLLWGRSPFKMKL